MARRIQHLFVIFLVFCVLILLFAVHQTAVGYPFTSTLVSWWFEDFNQPLEISDYYIEGSLGSAIVESGSFLLTENSSYKYGRIFFLQKSFLSEFDAEFDLYLGDNEWGSDGLAFHFCPVYDYPHSDGGSLNANCPHGYFIAFDTHNDNPPYNNEVYLAKGSVENRLVQVDVSRLDDDTWRHWRVSVADGEVTVAQGATIVIDAFEIPGYAPFGGYFGFSAATGGGSNRQRVDNIAIIATPLFQNFLPVIRR